MKRMYYNDLWIERDQVMFKLFLKVNHLDNSDGSWMSKLHGHNMKEGGEGKKRISISCF